MTVVHSAVSARAASWSENFTLLPSDIEIITHTLLETSKPQSIRYLTEVVVAARVAAEKQRVLAYDTSRGTWYMPSATYEVGQAVIFSQRNMERGVVQSVRLGKNPQIPGLQVITVLFSDQTTKMFASGLAKHVLNEQRVGIPASTVPIESAEEMLARHGESLQNRIAEQLQEQPSFLRLGDLWFLRDLLTSIDIGSLNLAEAVLDIMGGGPLSTESILQELDFPDDQDRSLLAFSLNYALSQDARFDEVGPAGQILWFLRRLEPDSVQSPPPRLTFHHTLPSTRDLPPATSDLLQQIGDEMDPSLAPSGDTTQPVDVILPYHHLISGTLPLTPALDPFFPRARYSPRVRFTILDGNSGERISGWVVREFSFVSGLAPIYKRYGAIVGTMIQISKGKNSDEVIVRVARRKPLSEWALTVQVHNNKLAFSNQKQIIGVSYREEMALVVVNPLDVEQIWHQLAERKLDFGSIVRTTFRELARLNALGRVHFITLYSVLNLIWRTPALPILEELQEKPLYEHVGDSYWRMQAGTGQG